MMKGLALLAVLLCGCDLYFGGGDDDVPPCYGTGGAQKDDGQRDPLTGNCEWNTGCDYDNGCGCAGTAEGDVANPPQADWGACYSNCTGLDEQSCFVTSGCFAAYIDDPAADGKRDFWGCWQTAPSGPVQGPCDNLDAYSCSRHDDCIAIYSGNADAIDTTYGNTKFEQCAAETATTYCIGDGDCGTDALCDHSVCYPSPTCTECPTCGACPDSNVCYGVCIPKDPTATCEQLTSESACIGRSDCMPVYDGHDCTCDANHCECQVLTYASCESL